VESVRPRGRLKKSWREVVVVGKDCRIQQLHKEDAIADAIASLLKVVNGES